MYRRNKISLFFTVFHIGSYDIVIIAKSKMIRASREQNLVGLLLWEEGEMNAL